jgi:hypothetical protein
MYLHSHGKRTEEESQRDEQELRGPSGGGASKRDILATGGNRGDSGNDGRVLQPESFRDRGPGAEGTSEKDALTTCAVHTAYYVLGMSKTLSIRGREYTVEVVDGANGPRYRLTGKRGGVFFTMRNAHKPHLMFVVSNATGNKSLDRVWLSDASGDLTVVQER